MKILYITTIGSTMGFFESLVGELIKTGNIVDIATNSRISEVPDFFKKSGCKIFNISTSRSPFSFGNIRAIKEIRKIASDYDIIHCHTPLAGMAARLACRRIRRHNNVKVIYTAHGFHFYNGAPIKNWIIYYPIERLCSRWTDVLITINREDYQFALKKMKAANVEYVPGVGIDLEKYKPNNLFNVEKKKKELNLPKESKIILSVGELNKNKNHMSVIEALGRIGDQSIFYVIAGEGELRDKLIEKARQLKVNLLLLGYRNDVKELFFIADLYVHPSYREGLPVALMESIATKTESICSNIRGCCDLVKKGLFVPNDIAEIERLIVLFISGQETNCLENYSRLDSFDIKKVNSMIFNIYGIAK